MESRQYQERLELAKSTMRMVQKFANNNKILPSLIVSSEIRDQMPRGGTPNVVRPSCKTPDVVRRSCRAPDGVVHDKVHI